MLGNYLHLPFSLILLIREGREKRKDSKFRDIFSSLAECPSNLSSFAEIIDLRKGLII